MYIIRTNFCLPIIQITRKIIFQAKVEARKNMNKTEVDDSVDIMPSVAEAARMKIRRGSEFGRYSHRYTMSMTKEPKSIVLLPPWPVPDDKKRPDNYNLFERRVSSKEFQAKL